MRWRPMTRKGLLRAIDRSRIQTAIERAERRTSGEIRVSVCPIFWGDVRRVAERAFTRLGMTETRERNGILFFVVPSRHRFAIVGDAGIHAKVGPEFWSKVADAVATRFRAGDFTGGLLRGIAMVGDLLAVHFPHEAALDVNELADVVDVHDHDTTRTRSSRGTSTGVTIHGFARPGFEAVRDAFASNFSRRQELGGACCIYRHGEKVVDLWGGIRNKATGEPWEEDTMVLVFSATKGLAAMTMALAHSRGWLDYDERVCTYWPEFAQQGKDQVTVRQLLAHQAGLFALGETVDRSVVADLDRLAVVLARQKPAWAPGSRQAYHAISLGFFEGELLRRVDPQHRSLGQFFQDEIATPLGLDFYIRLPESIPNSRLAVLEKRGPVKALLGLPRPLMLASMNPRSAIFRALMVNPGSWVSLDEKRVYARNLEVPSGGGVGTARAIARAYSVFATGGRELGLRPETLQALTAPAIPSAHGFYDEGVKGEVQFSLGFMKTCPSWPFGHAGAFGAPGAGGALGFADPHTGTAYAYVTNRMGGVTGDPRELALRNAIPAATADAGMAAPMRAAN
jgi:CubicO group peptidase (beta-lactamase class C family)